MRVALGLMKRLQERLFNCLGGLVSTGSTFSPGWLALEGLLCGAIAFICPSTATLECRLLNRVLWNSTYIVQPRPDHNLCHCIKNTQLRDNNVVKVEMVGERRDYVPHAGAITVDHCSPNYYFIIPLFQNKSFSFSIYIQDFWPYLLK